MLDTEIIWHVVSQPARLAVLAVTAVLAWPLGRLLGRGPAGAGFVLVLGAVLAATATTRTPYYSARGVEVYLGEFAGPLFAGFAGTDERLANIGLFLPLGLLATVVWRRPAATVLGCAALSFLIEGWQGFIGRGGDPIDVVHNAAGGLLGVTLAVVSRRWRDHRRSTVGACAYPRRRSRRVP